MRRVKAVRDPTRSDSTKIGPGHLKCERCRHINVTSRWQRACDGSKHRAYGLRRDQLLAVLRRGLHLSPALHGNHIQSRTLADSCLEQRLAHE